MSCSQTDRSESPLDVRGQGTRLAQSRNVRVAWLAGVAPAFVDSVTKRPTSTPARNSVPGRSGARAASCEMLERAGRSAPGAQDRDLRFAGDAARG
jgi:hypothetical protein